MYPDPEIFETQDGSHSLIAHQFGVSYHSKYGAIQESLHVFIQAGLQPFLSSRKPISVFEAGFGTGLNAFLTYLEADKWQIPIYYEAVEAYPISDELAAALNYPALLGKPEATAAFLQLHRQLAGVQQAHGSFFTLCKWEQRLETLRMEERFDVVYFDAFAPSAQPELWEPGILGEMAKALRPGGAFVTYCAKGIVKRRLSALGLDVQTLPGPPGKREMIRAWKP